MEAYIPQLAALLHANKPPSGVSSQSELEEWIKPAGEHIAAWIAANEEKIWAPEPVKEPEPVPEEKPKVPPAAPPAAPPAPLAPVVPASPTSPAPGGDFGSFEVNDPRLKDEWERVRANNDPQNWLLLGFEDATAPGSPKGATRRVVIVGKGDGGMPHLVQRLDSKQVMFGGFRVRAIDERGGVVSDRAKFVFVQWVGEHLSAVTKAKVAMQRADFDKIFVGAHLTVQVSDVSDLTEEAMTQRLHANTGAHRPSRYEY